jgi:hypothetical protein
MVNLRMEQPMSMKQVSTVHIWYLEGVCAVKTGGTSCHGEIPILPFIWKMTFSLTMLIWLITHLSMIKATIYIHNLLLITTEFTHSKIGSQNHSNSLNFYQEHKSSNSSNFFILQPIFEILFASNSIHHHLKLFLEIGGRRALIVTVHIHIINGELRFSRTRGHGNRSQACHSTSWSL